VNLTPEIVGRERRGGRQRRAGRAGAHTYPTDSTARRSYSRPGGLRKGEAVSVVPRPRKHRSHEARSVVFVSVANEGREVAVRATK